jgi:biopolymer transport protein ExbB/TolQ
VALAEPIERAINMVAGIHAEDLKWALSMVGGLSIGATGLYLHLAERRERSRLRLERLEDDARRARDAADADARRKQEYLELEQRIRLQELASHADANVSRKDTSPDRQAGGLRSGALEDSR